MRTGVEMPFVRDFVLGQPLFQLDVERKFAVIVTHIHVEARPEIGREFAYPAFESGTICGKDGWGMEPERYKQVRTSDADLKSPTAAA